MLRWALAVVLALAATPSRALVQFEWAEVYFGAVQFGGYFQPGLGTSGDSVSYSDIGGCEGADETGERCGGYENSSWSLNLADDGLVYSASLNQQHDIVPRRLDTQIAVIANFRADREMRLRPRENTDSYVACDGGACSSRAWSNLGQYQLDDGSWFAEVLLETGAATADGMQRLNHGFTMRISEVPEPHGWAMLIAGFGLIGAAQRRRRVMPRPC